MKNKTLTILLAVCLIVSGLIIGKLGFETVYWKDKYEISIQMCDNKLSYTNRIWMDRMERCQQMRTFYKENCSYVHND